MRKILVIDDDVNIRKLFNRFLQSREYEVEDADDGDVGLEKAEAFQPDLVLVDLYMPRLSGFDVIKILREKDSTLPIVVISGSKEIGDALNAINLGAWDYITKPLQKMDVLLNVISKSEEKRRLMQENTRYQSFLEEEVKKRTKELEEKNYELQIAIQKLDNEIKEEIRVKALLQKYKEQLNQELSYGELAQVFSDHAEFRSMLDKALTGFWITDEQEKTVYVNDKVSAIVGFSPQEILEMPVMEFFTPGEQSFLKDKINERRQGKADVYKIKMICKDNSQKWVMVSAAPLIDAEGQFKGSLAMINELPDFQDKTSNLLSGVPVVEKSWEWMVPYIEMDTSLNVINMNQIAMQITGTTPDVIQQGLKLKQLVAQEDGERIQEMNLTEFENGEKKKLVALRMLNTHRDSINVLMVVGPIREDGQVVRVAGNIIELQEFFSESVMPDKGFYQQYELTDREREVAELLIQGYSNTDIEKKLFISKNTLKTHISNIYSKFNTKNRWDFYRLIQEYQCNKYGQEAYIYTLIQHFLRY